MQRVKYQTVDEYIASFPTDTQVVLSMLRKIITEVVPDAEEVISYNIPAYKYHGFLIYFSAYKEHYSLSFRPDSAVFKTFKKELAEFKQSKSTIQFPYTKPLPVELIRAIVKLRASENLTLQG